MYYARRYMLTSEIVQCTVWEVAKEYEAKAKANMAGEQQRQAIEIQQRREEIRKQSLGGE